MSNPVRETIDWKAHAMALAVAFPIARLNSRVIAEIARSPVADRWHVAFSGGADSLALLLLLWAHWPERRSRLIAIHFNHGLRGAESDGDAAFCREVCAGLGVPLEAGLAEWPDGPDEVSEAVARDARLAFFKDVMAETASVLLFLGHQKDDVAETMLMRLARGSGTAGLAAPRPVSKHGTVTHLRPMLGLAHAEIVGALRDAGSSWREDATNFGDRYFRTRVRSTVIPALQDASPSDFLDAVSASRESLEEDDEALEAWADRVVPDRGLNPLPIAVLRECPRAVARRVLQRWVLAQGGEGTFSRAAFEELLGEILTATPFRRSAGDGAFVSGDAVRVTWEDAPGDIESWAPRRLAVPGCEILPDGGVLEAEVAGLDNEAKQALFSGASSGPFRVYLGFEAAPPPWFAVRTWQPGDRFASLGSTHDAKLQDHFTNRRIPKGMRHRLPVVTDPTGTVLWVPGLPPAESARVLSDATFAVRLTYKQPEPLSDPSHV